VFEFCFRGREMAMAMAMGTGDLLSWPRVQVPGCGSRGIVRLQGLRRRVVVLEESKRPLAMHKEFLDQVNELCRNLLDWIPNYNWTPTCSTSGLNPKFQ
jgi:hypothetical protein